LISPLQRSIGSSKSRFTSNSVVEKDDYQQCELDQKRVTADENCIGPLAHKSCEGRIALPTGAGVEVD
jgi:hypothetical protein